MDVREREIWVGLDVGSRRIGVAQAERRAGLPSPWFTLNRRGVQADVERLRQRWGGAVVGVVVGLPLTDDGREQRSTRLARQIGDALVACGLTVHFQDERYTTLEAERRMAEAGVPRRRRDALVDEWAAAIILEDWLSERDARS